MSSTRALILPLLSAALVAGCATTGTTAGSEKPADTKSGSSAKKSDAPKEPVALMRPYTTPADPYPSTYKPPQSAPTLIRGATVLTGTGTKLDNADVLVVDGRIA